MTTSGNTSAQSSAIDARLRDALSTAGLGTWDADLATGEVRYNAALARIYGFGDADGTTDTRSIVQLVHADDLAPLTAAGARARDQQSEFVLEHRARRTDGAQRWVLARGIFFYDDAGVARHASGTVVDITDRRVAEDAVRDSEARYRTLVEMSPEGVVVHVGGIIRYANAASLRLARASDVSELVGHPVLDFVHPDDHALALGRIAVALEGGGALPITEMRIIAVDGTEHLCDVSSALVSIGGETALQVLIRDVGERKAVELAWHVSEQRFQMLAVAIPSVFYLARTDVVRVEYVSPAFETVWGRAADDVLREPRLWLEMIHPDDRERVRDGVVRTRETAFEAEYRVVRPDGSVRWVRDRSFPVVNAFDGVHRRAGLAEDVTERVQLEARLRQAEKMEAIGQLAGGIAHDFNNLLTIITSSLDLARAEIGANAVVAGELDAIGVASERAARLTRQLLAYGRKQVMQPVLLDLDATVTDIEEMLRRLIGENIALEWRPAGALPGVNLDPGQLAHVLINLSVNARDAMPRGGVLTISTGVARVDDARATTLGVPAGRYVTLAVRDTGVGMDANTRSHIFEPFFTTKPLCEGTGLGLATVQGIVAQSGGAIAVDSMPDAGTNFTVLFPVAAAPAVSPPPERATHAAGHETVLVVEDDTGVRTLTRRLLERHGYAVLEASDGREALAMVRRHLGQLDMVLTDVRMPHLGGGELATILHAERPEIALCMMTGYAADELETVPAPAGIRIIEKPFTSETLLAAVREVLGKSSA